MSIICDACKGEVQEGDPYTASLHLVLMDYFGNVVEKMNSDLIDIGINHLCHKCAEALFRHLLQESAAFFQEERGDFENNSNRRSHEAEG